MFSLELRILKIKYSHILVLIILFFAHCFANPLSSQVFSDTSISYPFSSNQFRGIYLNKPKNLTEKIVFDANTNNYILYQKIGNLDFTFRKVLSFEEYMSYQLEKMMTENWRINVGNQGITYSQTNGLPKLYIGGEAFDKVFGGNTVDIRPQGSTELIFSLRINRLDNPNYTVEQRKTTSFDFQEKIQMNVIGKIGEKLKDRELIISPYEQLRDEMSELERSGVILLHGALE